MDQNNIIEKIVIIDFGSQFTQLIARKIRELGVYSEIINFKQIKDLIKNKSLKGIILSGGPLTVTNKNAPKLNTSILSLKIPILGICYGHQILTKKLGGRVKISKKREFGKALVKSKSKNPIFKNDFSFKTLSVTGSAEPLLSFGTNGHHKPPDFFSGSGRRPKIFGHMEKCMTSLMGVRGRSPPGNFEGFESRKYAFPP